VNEPNASASKRFLELDGLRGIAAFGVMFFHFTGKYDEFFGHTSPPLLSIPRSYGVELFFIISGFVMLMMLGKTRSIWDFAVARIGRLYPTYWAAIILTFGIVSLASFWPEGQPSLRDTLINFTMLQQFVGAQNVDGAYWTFQVQLLFQVLLGAIFVLGLLRRIEWVAAGLLLLSIADWASIRSGFASTTAGGILNDLLTLALAQRRITYFVTGMILFLCWKHGLTPLRGALVLASVAVTFVTLGGEAGLVHGIHTTIVALAALGMLPFLRYRPFVFLGFISYPLYLIHQNIGYVVIDQFESRGITTNVAIPLAMAVMMAMALALAVVVEQPSTKAIKRGWAAVKASMAARGGRQASVPASIPSPIARAERS
jgi:peptidoglycan/LPS O-acetylase OafA/YrhL